MVNKRPASSIAIPCAIVCISKLSSWYQLPEKLIVRSVSWSSSVSLLEWKLNICGPYTRQLHPVHTLIYSFPNIIYIYSLILIPFKIILPPKWCIIVRYSNQKVACISHTPYVYYTLCTFHFILFTILIILSEVYKL
jgi:hypothetical protein